MSAEKHAGGKRDLTGQRFGRLTVLKEVEPRIVSGKPFRRWLCRCDCGVEKEMFQNALTASNHAVQSCGCLGRKKRRGYMKDMAGQRFGRLTVLEATRLPEPDSNGNTLAWRCRCDCGEEVIRRRKDLLSGRVNSCGCWLPEKSRRSIVEQNVLKRYDGTSISAIDPKRGANKNSKSGVKGVYWNKREKRWIAKIGIKGKSITLGRFRTLEEAAEARKAGEEKYFTPIIQKYELEHKKVCK